MTGIAYDEESKIEITDGGRFDVLHMHGFPADIVPAINKYNREHPGPDGNAINITMTCIDALRAALKARESHTMQDTRDTCVYDEKGVKIMEGDVVAYVITGPDAYAEWEGIVAWEHGKFVIKSGKFQFDLDDTEVLRLIVKRAASKAQHPLQGLTHIPNVGPVELKRAADLIKGMGYRPDNEPGLKGRECQCIVVDEGTEDAESDDRAQTGDMMDYTDKSIWLCPRCVTVITDLEYEHLNLNGRCGECDTVLEEYKKVEVGS